MKSLLKLIGTVISMKNHTKVLFLIWNEDCVNLIQNQRVWNWQNIKQKKLVPCVTAKD